MGTVRGGRNAYDPRTTPHPSNPGALFGGSGRIIFYSFGNEEPYGYAAPSHLGDRMHIVRVDGASEHGVWRQHAAHPASDYRRIRGRRPPPITAIGLMQNTHQTEHRAVAEIRRLDLTTPPAEATLDD